MQQAHNSVYRFALGMTKTNQPDLHYSTDYVYATAQRAPLAIALRVARLRYAVRLSFSGPSWLHHMLNILYTHKGDWVSLLQEDIAWLNQYTPLERRPALGDGIRGWMDLFRTHPGPARNMIKSAAVRHVKDLIDSQDSQPQAVPPAPPPPQH
eukprot:9487201-Pyramimonas_sp.AAC.1